MDDPNWRDQFLSDIIEAQVVLLGHFTATLEAAGLTTREDTAGLLRAVADNQDLRQGVQVTYCTGLGPPSWRLFCWAPARRCRTWKAQGRN